MPAKATKPKYGIGVGSKPIELILPSGNTCLARRPGAQGLIKAGLLDDLDQLTSLVQVEHIDSKDPRQMARAVQGLSKDPKKILEAMKMIDKVLAFVVVAPKVLLAPEKPEVQSEEDWDEEEAIRALQVQYPDAVFAHDVDEEDKMFVFQWCVGGTSDLVAFREESKSALVALSALEDVPVPAERASGS